MNSITSRPYLTDNRWSPGASGATVPDTAPAAYAARWIDHGDVADVVGDRQGFAYHDSADRDLLIAVLREAEAHTAGIVMLDRDVTEVTNHGPATIARRRCGGYIYVDAWLDA